MLIIVTGGKRENRLSRLDDDHLYIHPSYALSAMDGGVKHLGVNVGLSEHPTVICVASNMS